MEESLISYSNGKQYDHTTGEEEESGWTTYFDDFFASQTRLNNDDDDHHQHQQQGTNSSSSCLVSDAASCVEYLKSSNNMSSNSNTLFGPSPKFSKKLKFKKTRTKGILSYDDSLEDTASSPVNSPKVGSLKEMEFNQRRAYDFAQSSMVQVGGFDDQFQVQRDGSRDVKMGFEGENNNNNNNINNDMTNLRKKGMCLVPVSMLANYLG